MRAREVTVEAPLRLDVTPGGRGTRAFQTEPLCRDEAAPPEKERAAQVGIAFAVAVRGWPKRNDR